MQCIKNENRQLVTIGLLYFNFQFYIMGAAAFLQDHHNLPSS